MKHTFLKEQVIYLLDEFKQQQLSALEVYRGIIDAIRPSKEKNSREAEQKIKELNLFLNKNPELKKIFSSGLVSLVGEANQTELFTHVTALSRSGFFAELRKLVLYKILPPVENAQELGFIIRAVFYRKKDYEWVSQIDDKVLADFIYAAGIIPSSMLPTQHYITQELLDDLHLLTQVVTALSVDTSIIKNFDELLTKNSPFNCLHSSVASWIAEIRKGTSEKNIYSEGYKNVIHCWNECDHFLNKIHDSRNEFGTSLHLTIVLQKLKKCLYRVLSLLNLLVHNENNHDYVLLAQFVKNIVRIENQKYSVRHFLNETVSTLAYQITEHTGKSGEHYVTNNAKEYASMFFNSLKGGFVIAFMVILKFVTSTFKLPILQDTLLKGFNYSIGFVGIHLWHGVVATKQPAMTASTIAQSIEGTTTQEEIKELGNVIIKVFRSQFAAVMGNLLMVFPVTFLLTYGYYLIVDKPLMSVEDAHHKFEIVNPIHSLALFHAAIAGVMLFLAGIFSGLADNGNMFSGYSKRLEHAGLIQRAFGKNRAKKIADYVANNLGSLTGNFSLGFLLAFVSFIGYITGLPLDIQHVTFATGNLGFAMASIYDHITFREGVIALIGIAGIGLTNIGVSFTLTMIVAIKSRGIDLNLTPGIFSYVVKEFFKRPLSFLFPAKEKKEI